ncbi:MAG: hypothetical protein AB8G99_26635 [Planctomycetaceae bacterium]
MSELGIVDIFEDDDLVAVVANPSTVRRANFLGIRHRSLEALSECVNLTHLSVFGLHHTGTDPKWSDTTKDFYPLHRLPRLRHLSIRNCWHFDEAQLLHVAGLSRLRGLSIANCPHNAGSLAGLIELRVLQLSRGLPDLTFTKQLSNLEYVYLGGNGVAEPVVGLESLASIRSLKSGTFDLRHYRKLPVRLPCETHFCGKRDKKTSNFDAHAWWETHTGLAEDAVNGQ